MAEKIAFLSDMHLGSVTTTQAEVEGLADCLESLMADDSLTRVVLLGDILDTWTTPARERPSDYEEILEATHNARVVAALKALAAKPKVSLHYCWGNHDFDLPAHMFRQNFPSTQMADAFTLGFLWGEHGHRFDLFNACQQGEPTADPAGGCRPLGYYISRLHAQAVVSGRARAFGHNDDYLLQAVKAVRDRVKIPADRDIEGKKVTIPLLVLWYVMGVARMSYEDSVVMPDGSNVTLQQVSDAFENSMADWEQAHPDLGSALDALVVSMDTLDWAAQRIRTQEGKRLVVLGHSHLAKWNDLTIGPGVEGAYANDGAWSKNPQTLVVVTCEPVMYNVECRTWKGESTTHRIKAFW